MWVEFTAPALLSRVTGPEFDALQTAATSPEQEDVLADIAATIVADWRAVLARVAALSKRRLALPTEVEAHVLAHFRHAAFTRLPGMKRLLDEGRVREWERANKIHDNLAKLVIEPPDPDDLLDDGGAAPMTPGITVPRRAL
jgi:hypothetical protein